LTYHIEERRENTEEFRVRELGERRGSINLLL
jgi:hypothetical protein